MAENLNARPLPAKSMASVLFACSSVLLFEIDGRLHSMPTHFAKESDVVFHRVLSEAGPIRSEADIGYRVLAVLALAWGIWAWRTESRVAASMATPFAALAVVLAIMVG